MKKIMLLLMAAIMIFALLPMAALATSGVSYVDENGQNKTVENYTEVNENSTVPVYWSGVVCVTADATLSGSVTLSEDTKLILADGVTLTVLNGIGGGRTLTVYGQKDGTGTLKVSGSDAESDTGFNGENGFSGNVIICGGVVSFKGGNGSSGDDMAGKGGSGVKGDVAVFGDTAIVNITGGNGGNSDEMIGAPGEGILGTLNVNGGKEVTVVGGLCGHNMETSDTAGCGVSGEVKISAGSTTLVTIKGGKGLDYNRGGSCGNGGVAVNNHVTITGDCKVVIAGGECGHIDGFLDGFGGTGINGSLSVSGHAQVEITSGCGFMGFSSYAVQGNVTISENADVTITGGGSNDDVGSVAVGGNLTASGYGKAVITAGFGYYSTPNPVSGNVTAYGSAEVDITGGQSLGFKGGDAANNTITVAESAIVKLAGGSGLNGNGKAYSGTDSTKVVATVQTSTDGASYTNWDGTTALNSFIYLRLTASTSHIHVMGDDVIVFDNAWNDATKLPDAAGNYYLDTDVTLSETWSLPVGTINLCLNDHVIQLANGKTGSVVSIPSDSALNLFDCAATEHAGYLDADGLWHLGVGSGTAKTIVGGVITGGNKDNGGCVYVGGSFTMNGGTIAGTTAFQGGGVYVGAGSFTMNGGTITNCLATKRTDGKGAMGGGVYVYAGSFTLNGGTITNCSAERFGGGVSVDINATLDMSGGTISNCSANSGGGGINTNGKVTISGGTISDCTAGNGGGLRVVDNEEVTISGGTISGNTANTNGGGVYTNVTFTLGGTAQITDNASGEENSKVANNVFLTDGVCIALGEGSDAPAQNMEIGLTMASGTGAFTSNGTADDAKWFTPDNADNMVIYKAGHLEFAPTVAYNYTKQIKYSSLAEAVSAAVSGDEIELWANENAENVVLPDGVTLYAKSGYTGTVTTDAAGKSVAKQDMFGEYQYKYFIANALTITYKDQGDKAFTGTHESEYPTTFMAELALELKSATKVNYTFGGWFDNAECTGTPITGFYAYTYIDNITLYAKWICNHTTQRTKVDGQAPTESNPGWKSYYVCECGEFFADEAGTTPIEDLTAWKASASGGYLAPLNHQFSITAIGNVLTATCLNPDGSCTLEDNKVTLTLVIPEDASYNGQASQVGLLPGEAEAWLTAVGTEPPAIVYYLSDGVTKTTPENSGAASEGAAPVWAGEYNVKMVGGDVDIAEAKFIIASKPLTNGAVVAIEPQTCTDSALTPAIVVKDGDVTLIKDEDYTVAYENNTNVGTATVIVTLCGNYEGELTASFEITKATYEIIEGADSIWKDEDGNLSFRSNAPYATFLYVKVDGVEIDASNYEVTEGSAIVTLKETYLNTLSVGVHTLTIASQNGDAETEFEITSTGDDPNTGDNTVLWISILLLSVGCMAVTVIVPQKRKA